VVPHPKLALDHLGDSAQRPALGLEPGRLGATPEEPEELVPLGSSQPGGPAGGMALTQAAHPRSLEAVLPARHRCPAHAQLPRNRGLGQLPGSEQPSGREAALFQLDPCKSGGLPYHDPASSLSGL